ncbi:MAG: hypothetical protein ACREQQ_05770 [Candidatus Binatia bacterium]
MQRASEARRLMWSWSGGSGSSLILALSIALLPSDATAAADRFTVCSITINSDDEIRMLERFLPESEFQFVELTDHARTTAANGETSWFEKSCRSGVHCDVLVVSGHFGNTWAGNYGTTFAGRSGVTLSLAELERRRCDRSCDGILADPLEVFLFGCKTLSATSDGPMLPPGDLAAFGRYDVAPASAERIFDEARNKGEATSSRERMRFVFAGVPRVYGFTDVAPAGHRVAPLFEKYLAGVGDYAEHLRRLRATSSAGRFTPNDPLASALEPTCFAQCGGLDPAEAEYARNQRSCLLKDGGSQIVRRLEQVEKLLDEPRFLTHLPAIGAVVRAHDAGSSDPAAAAVLARIRNHARARNTTKQLLGELDDPTLRLEILRIGRSVGWITDAEALPVERQIVARLLRPPVYGEGRDLICGLGADVLGRIQIRAEDVPSETYRDEFGIQALACLKPADERIHERLARSLSDSREWIVRLAGLALGEMTQTGIAVRAAVLTTVGGEVVDRLLASVGGERVPETVTRRSRAAKSQLSRKGRTGNHRTISRSGRAVAKKTSAVSGAARRSPCRGASSCTRPVAARGGDAPRPADPSQVSPAHPM